MFLSTHSPHIDVAQVNPRSLSSLEVRMVSAYLPTIIYATYSRDPLIGPPNQLTKSDSIAQSVPKPIQPVPN